MKSETITLFFRKPMNIYLRAFRFRNIGKSRRRRKCILFENEHDCDFLLYSQKMIISYEKNNKKEAMDIINTILEKESGIGIRVYNKNVLVNIMSYMKGNNYNIL